MFHITIKISFVCLKQILQAYSLIGERMSCKFFSHNLKKLSLYFDFSEAHSLIICKSLKCKTSKALNLNNDIRLDWQCNEFIKLNAPKFQEARLNNSQHNLKQIKEVKGPPLFPKFTVRVLIQQKQIKFYTMLLDERTLVTKSIKQSGCQVDQGLTRTPSPKDPILREHEIRGFKVLLGSKNELKMHKFYHFKHTGC